ncbi:hypothetical protein [Rhizobium sp. MHM7A]|uniref:hypothetical protein n=1 Tax=Rhizobium sp. MHM7A TaxID=2583233 RepID=UPI0011068B88|nr:hypothetical protein [Rhizobium sp. MHM7A]TLX16869.1 hypothetical protein FFR93_05850 [Rhizobium sp. MHM7A]
MNTFRATIKEGSLRYEDVARILGLDVATLIQFGLKVGFINLDTCMAICNLLDVSFFDLFPSLDDMRPELGKDAELEDELPFIYALFEKTENHPKVLGCGIDPDLRPWYVAVHLTSGVERRYRLSSVEKNRLDNAMTSAKDTKGYFVFHADCQTIILRRSAVQDVRFSNAMSYAQFSSDERAFAATVVLPNSPFPAVTGMTADDSSPGGHGSPLYDLINIARAGGDLPAFIRLPEEEELRFLQIENMEVLEIPVGLTIPGFYDDDEDDGQEVPETLLLMEAMGTA